MAAHGVDHLKKNKKKTWLSFCSYFIAFVSLGNCYASHLDFTGYDIIFCDRLKLLM